MRSFAILFFCAGVVVPAVDTPTSAQSRPAYASSTDQRVHPRRYKRVVRPPGRIACGKYGCHPIPPGCRPEPGFDWRGNPTGYDVTVCR